MHTVFVVLVATFTGLLMSKRVVELQFILILMFQSKADKVEWSLRSGTFFLDRYSKSSVQSR